VNFEFKPEQVNLLLGRNGSGKSTLIEALHALASLLSGDSPQVVLPLDSLPWWDVRRLQRFELDLKDGEDTFHYSVAVRQHEREAPRIVEEKLFKGTKRLFEFAGGTLELAGLATRLPVEGTQSVLAMGLGLDASVGRFLTLAKGVLVFRLNPWAFELSARDEARMLSVNGMNLVAFLRSWSQSDPASFLKWKKSALEAMPHLEDLQLRELVPGSRMLVGMKHVDGRERLLSLESMSEGERILLALRAIAGLATPQHTIALDEPDNFLAASEVQPVLRSLTLDAEVTPGAQLLIITHHPESIDYLASYPTWFFEKSDDGLARVRRLEFDRSVGERPTDSLLAEMSA
jgi:predicted ATPase